MDSTGWNSVTVVQLVVASFVPISVAGIGFWIVLATKRLEARQFTNQKLVERRISFTDTVTEKLNDLYCYYRWVGNWKTFSPVDILARKRDLDRSFYIHRPFLTAECMDSYKSFMNLLFRTYVAVGADALLRTAIVSPDGDRSAAYVGTWETSWETMFSPAQDQITRDMVPGPYDELMRLLAQQLDVT